MTTLYEQDYGLWAEEMARLLAEGKFAELDIENLVEEIGDLSKRERDKLLSSIRLILHHLLKWDYQVQRRCQRHASRTRSWQITIERERINIALYLKDSPSLHRYLCEEWLENTYRIARLDAAKETGLDFPADCAYSIEDVLERPIILK